MKKQNNMKISKETIKKIINNTYSIGIINKEHFYNLLLEKSYNNYHNKNKENIFKVFDKNHLYEIYYKNAMARRINEKIDFLCGEDNIVNKRVFRDITISMKNICDDDSFYDVATENIITNLCTYKNFVFPYFINKNDEYKEYDEYDDSIYIEENNYDYNIIKKDKLKELLINNNLLLHCKQCKEYYDNKSQSFHNRWYEKEKKLIVGAFDYLLKQAVDNEDTATIEEMTRGINNFVYSKSKANLVVEHIKKRNAKYTDNGERNYIVHNQFKKDLLKNMSECAITETTFKTNSGVQCCHIKPYLVCDPDECKDGNNGILLLHKFHVMFDKGMISFNDDGSLLISPYISYENMMELKKYNINEKFNIGNNNGCKNKYLKWHRKNVFLDGKECDTGFNFNYYIKDWEVRNEIVKHYIFQTGLDDKLTDLIIENTIITFDKNDNPIYIQKNCKELTELRYYLCRIYNYILYAIDKKLVKEKKQTKEQRDAMENDKRGIKSYIKPKRGKVYKEPKWASIDLQTVKKNEDRILKFNVKTGKIIKKQKESYKRLIEEVAKKDRKHMEDKKLNRSNIITELHDDIRICNHSEETINEVCISSCISLKHDNLKDTNISYDKKFIRTVLNNWRDIVIMAKNNPSSTIHDIYMDFEDAFKKIKTTNKQKDILDKIFNGINIVDGEKSNFDNVIEKIYNYFRIN